MNSTRTIAVIGVSGAGKSTVAACLANQLDFEYLDADDLHLPGNIERMRLGQSLSDSDRAPWLRDVGQRIVDSHRSRPGIVVACSALRKVYRNIIREYDSSTYFVLLNGTEELIRSRVESRTHQFMSPALLSSQFALLEELGDDERGQSIDIACSIDHIVDAIVESVTPDCHNDSSS